MHQKRYALEILKKFEMEHSNMAITHAKPQLQLSNHEDEQDINLRQYRRLIGSLWYLCNTRLNFTYSVGIVSKFMGKPEASHLATINRILRYVKCLIGCKIIFPTMGRGRSCK